MMVTHRFIITSEPRQCVRHTSDFQRPVRVSFSISSKSKKKRTGLTRLITNALIINSNKTSSGNTVYESSLLLFFGDLRLGYKSYTLEFE